MLNKFHERFAIDVGVDEAKRRFVNRVLNFLFGRVASRDQEERIWGLDDT